MSLAGGFTGLSGYATYIHFQKAVFRGTLIVARNMAVRDLTEAIYLLIMLAKTIAIYGEKQNG